MVPTRLPDLVHPMKQSTPPGKLLLASLVCLAWTASSSSPAQAPRPPSDFLRTFIQLDVNKDQAISRGEVPDSARDSFDTLLKHGDLDMNGQLEAEELRTLGERLRQAGPVSLSPGIAAAFQQRFRQADRDGDGKISREEFPNGRQAFDRFDADGDGFITPREARARTAGQGAPQTPGNQLQSLLRQMDRNGDGSISQDEFRGPPALFNRLDRNGDRAIGPDERNRILPDIPPRPEPTEGAPAGPES